MAAANRLYAEYKHTSCIWKVPSAIHSIVCLLNCEVRSNDGNVGASWHTRLVVVLQKSPFDRKFAAKQRKSDLRFDNEDLL